MSARGRSTPLLRPAAVGLALTVAVVGLFALWWLYGGGGRRHVPTARVPGAPPRSAERSLPAVIGPVTRFDRQVAEELLRDRPGIAAMHGGLRLSLDRIAWDDDRGRPFLRAARATGRLDLDALLRGDAVVTAVDAVKPEVWVYRAPGDTLWNWEHVLAAFLAPPAPGEPVRRPGAERLVEVRGVTVHDGFASVRHPEFETRFLGIEATLPRITLSAPRLPAPIVQLAQASATFERPDRRWRLPLTGRDAVLTFPGQVTRFTVGELAFGHSLVTGIDGTYDSNQPGLGVRATGTAPAFDLADLKAFAPTLDLTGAGSFAWSMEPTRDNGLLLALSNLRYRSEGSLITGAVAFTALADTARPTIESADLRLEPVSLALAERLSGRKLPYTGNVTGRVTGSGADIRFDLTGHLATRGAPPFTVGLNGNATFGPGGVTLRNAVADLQAVPLAALRAVAPGLATGGTVSGRVTLSGPMGRAPLRLDARLTLPTGVALVRGSLTWAGAASSYDVTGSLLGIRLRDLVAVNVPPASLTATFAARGTGFAAATATSTFRLDGRFTGWKSDANDLVAVRGSLAGGVLRLDTLNAGLATATLGAGGVWPFSAGGAGSLRYNLAITDLAPFTAYLPAPAAGRAGGAISLAGTVTGTLQSPRFSGGLALAHAAAGGWGVGEATGTYTLQLGGPVPQIGLGLQARSVTTPTNGQFSAVTASGRLLSPALDVTLRAERPNGGVVELAANGSVPATGPRVVTVSRLLADVGDHRWQLMQPAVVRWVQSGPLTVQNLLVQESGGPGRLALNGTLLPADASDYRLEVAALPVAALYQLAGQRPPFSGLLYATANVRGPATAPRVAGTFHLDSGTVQGVQLRTLQGTLDYGTGRMTADVRAALAQGGSVTANAALPLALTLGLPPRGRLEATGAVQGSLVADSVPLALLASLTTQVSKVTGVFSGRMTLAGTAQQPVLAGAATLRGGALTVAAANQRYTDIAGTLTLRDRRILLDSLTARSDGTAVLSGFVDFPELRNPTAELALAFARFRPLGTADNPQAAVWGRLSVTGPLLAPTVRGGLRLDDGNLMIPAAAGGADITGEANALGLSDMSPAGAQAVPAVPVSDRMRLDGVQLTAGPALWFQTPDARVQLSGTLTVDRAPESGMRILGTLEGRRGSYAVVAGLFVRRLDITQARIRFLGTTELDPQIDIVATKTVLTGSSSQVDIQAHVTGTLENPRLALSTAQGVQIPESELLSFLVFGQPSFALGEGTVGQTLLRQTLTGGIAELASMQLEQSLTSSGLPLDVLEIQASAGGTPENLVVGRELAPDVFITVQTAIGVLFGNAGQNTGEPVALRIDWRATPRLTATLGWEPPNQARTLPAFFTNLISPQQLTRQNNQFTIELRRRWTY